MRITGIFRRLVLVITCVAMLLPSAWADTPTGPAAAPREKRTIIAHDIVLDGQGGLQGVVVDVQGVPQARVPVVLVKGNREVGRVKADGTGRFRVAGLRGGVYVLQAGGQGKVVRAWTAKVAPPAAKPLVLMVVGNELVRGQMPLEDFCSSDAFVITGLVGAVIAIPIILHNQDSDSQPSTPSS